MNLQRPIGLAPVPTISAPPLPRNANSSGPPPYPPPPGLIIPPPAPTSLYPTIPQPVPPSNTYNPNPAFLSYPTYPVGVSYPASNVPTNNSYPKQQNLSYPNQALKYLTSPMSLLPPYKINGKKKSKLKKAMKYGLPLAGAGVGAYAISKMFKRSSSHSRSSSSSSSSSSDSD